jgi:hypothetical protein
MLLCYSTDYPCLWNKKMHCCTYKMQPVVYILGQLNLGHILVPPRYILILSPPTSGTPTWYLPFRFLDKTLVIHPPPLTRATSLTCLIFLYLISHIALITSAFKSEFLGNASTHASFLRLSVLSRLDQRPCRISVALFNIFSAILHVWRPTPHLQLRTCSAALKKPHRPRIPILVQHH